MNVSQSAISVARWASLRMSLVASAANASPIAWLACGAVGEVVGVARRRVARATTISDWRRVYLRIPSLPWREPRPDSFQPPIGSSSAA